MCVEWEHYAPVPKYDWLKISIFSFQIPGLRVVLASELQYGRSLDSASEDGAIRTKRAVAVKNIFLRCNSYNSYTFYGISHCLVTSRNLEAMR